MMILAAMLAGLIGFAAHRASFCTVAAVKELLTTRRALMLASFAKIALWVVGITLLLASVLPADFLQISGWKLSLATLAGGALFGIGATINGGCAFSTLTRLGNGNLGLLVSLAGFLVGAGLHSLAGSAGLTPDLVKTAASLSKLEPWRLPVTAALGLWMAWEIIQLIRTVGLDNWRDRLLAPRYRLSTAAVLMGCSNAVLYAIIGIWPYTRLFGDSARQAASGTPAPPAMLWLLFFALIGGIAVSAWQGRRFRLRWQPGRSWAGFAAGGVLMGLGAAMIPGGNDVIILYSIPSFSPHAVPAFLAMLAGIAGTLLVLRARGGDIPPVDCDGDICTEEILN